MKKPSKLTKLIKANRSLKQAKREIRFLQKERKEQEALRKSQKESYDIWKHNYKEECDKKVESAQKSVAKDKQEIQKTINEVHAIKLAFEKNQSRQNRTFHEVNDLVQALVKKVECVSPEALQAKHAQLSNDYAKFIRNNPSLLNDNLQ